MSASNFNWVCFDCRRVVRQAKTARRIPKCAECGSDCFCLGYKVDIPRNSDTNGWKALRLECRKRNLALSDSHGVKRVKDAHAAERRIVELRSRGANKDREKLVSELTKKIKG